MTVFPALSKHVSREQGVSKNGQAFSPETLWAAVEKCWKNFPLDVLARSCVRHHQVASAIATCSGGDDFVKERGGLHCNVRNCCVTACGNEGRPTGVEVVSSYMESNLEEEQQQTLKCSPPELLEEDRRANLAKMPPAEAECLFHHVSVTSPVHECVQDQFIANEMVAGLEEEEPNVSVVGV